MANRWAQVAVGCAATLGLAGQVRAESRPSITVIAYNHAGVSADTLARAKSDVTRICREAGVEVTWMDPAAVEPTSHFAIRLLIRPRAVNATGSVMGTALGDTHETGGSAFVFYDRVLRSAHDREQDVACVLAYAMAHEMGHLLLPYPAHSTTGIMRAEWNGDDLRHIASRSLGFAPDQAELIRRKAATCCDLQGLNSAK